MQVGDIGDYSMALHFTYELNSDETEWKLNSDDLKELQMKAASSQVTFRWRKIHPLDQPLHSVQVHCSWVSVGVLE
jgi:hypothetical protein